MQENMNIIFIDISAKFKQTDFGSKILWAKEWRPPLWDLNMMSPWKRKLLQGIPFWHIFWHGFMLILWVYKWIGLWKRIN